MNTDKIIKCLSDSMPFLLMDKIISLIPGKSINIMKNISSCDPFMKKNSISYHMPGMLILEAMAQAGYVCLYSMERQNEVRVFLDGIDKVRFLKNPIPGDCMEVVLEFEKSFAASAKGSACAYVDGAKVCESLLTYSISESLDKGN